MSTQEEIGARLRAARKARHFTSADAAADAMTIPQGTYRGHENGKRGFTRTAAVRYAKFFRVNLNWLLTGDGPRERSVRVRDEADDLPEPYRKQALNFIEFLRLQAAKE